MGQTTIINVSLENRGLFPIASIQKQLMSFFKPGIAGTTLAAAGGVYWALLTHLAILFIIIYPLAAPASSDTYACANPLISIEADEPVGYQLICNSADDALAFFDRLDVKLTSHLVIEVAQNLPDGMSKTAVGCYD